MDKNTVAGIIAVGAILLGFSWWNSGRESKYAEAVAQQEAVVEAAPMPEEVPVEILAADSVEAESLTFSNEVMDVVFSTRGAHIEQVSLHDYSKYGTKEPLRMYEQGSARFGMSFWLAGNKMVNTADRVFSFVGEEPVEGARRLVFELPVDSLGGCVQYIYTLFDKEYMMDFDVRFEGFGENGLSNQMSSLIFDWGATLPQQEKGFTNENNYSGISYKAGGEKKIHDFGRRKTDADTKSITGNVEWVAMKQQFFTTTFLADGNFQNAEINYQTLEEGTGLLKRFSASANVPYMRSQVDYGFRIYVGPVKYSTLKAYDAGMERLVSLGGWSLVRWVNTILVIPVFNFLTRNPLNIGLVIFLLTLMIKVIILPLTYKSYLSMAKMRVLKPEIDAINERYPKPEDAMKKQQATLELYKKAGANPMGGCLPMLIQFPIIIALFYFFPTAIELRGQSFLWAEDLSTYDSVLALPFSIPFYGTHVSLFTILMAVSLWLNQKLTSRTQPTGPGAGMMKSMMVLMPVMMLFFFNNYSSGLTYYYTLSNIITILTTWLMQVSIDDEKLHARMKAVAAKKSASKKPKSKWQQRYEEAVRQQQAMRKR